MQRTTRWLCLYGALFFPGCSDDGTATDEGNDSMATTGSDEPTGSGDEANPDDGSASEDDTLGDTSTGPSGNDSADDDDSDPSTDDGDDNDDSDDSESTGGLEPVEATIYEVQDGTIDEEQAVRISGAIVTAVAPSGLFVQDPAGGEYSAVFVFPGNNGPNLDDYAVGDEVDFVGLTDEFYDFTQVIIGEAGSLEVVESGGAEAVPEPQAIEPDVFSSPGDAEPWESVLVRVESDALVVTSVGVEGEEGVNEFIVAAGDTDSFVVDDFIFDIVDDEGDSFPGFGEQASFTAIVGTFNYSFEAFKIAPRSADDLEGYVAPVG